MRTVEIESHAILGWREWVLFPELDMGPIKAKIDTGARTSALHAYDIEFFNKGEVRWVRFRVHPRQRDERYSLTAETEVIDMRLVKNSGGKETLRPVIKTKVRLGSSERSIELTLINRDAMGFRLLIGRQALRKGCLVHPGRSYLASGHMQKSVRGKREKNKKGRGEL